MLYFICSDVHGNLEALQAVVQAAEREKADKFLMLGDIVGYGANPQECLWQIRKTADVVLAGNHDFAAASLTDLSSFNPVAKAAILWTRDRLQAREAEYLAQLPLLYGTEDFFLSTRPPGTLRGGITCSAWRMQSGCSPTSLARSVSSDILTSLSSSPKTRRGAAGSPEVPGSICKGGFATS